MARKKKTDTASDASLLRGFNAAKRPERRVERILKICREAEERAPSLLEKLKPRCGVLAFDDQLAACVFRARDDDRTYLIKPREDRWQPLPCEPFAEVEWVGRLNGASAFVGRFNGDGGFHVISVVFTETSGEFFHAALGKLKKRDYQQLKKDGRWPARWQWTPAKAQAPPVVARNDAPAGVPDDDSPAPLDDILDQIARAVRKTVTGSNEVPGNWAAAALDARWVPSGTAFASCIKIRDKEGRKLREILASHETMQLLREAYQRRNADGQRWHGVLVTINRKGRSEVTFNFDPECLKHRFYD